MSHPQVHLADFQAFKCNSCGLCCTRPWNVRVEPEVREGIRESEIHARREREGYIPLEVLESGFVNAHRQRNGNCMFLLEDVRCGIHSELGSKAKPIGCQLFPYRATTTPLGTYFALSFACPTVVVGADRDVETNRAELTEVLGRWPNAADIFGEVSLAMDSTREISWESYQALEDWMLATFEESAPLDSLLSMATTIKAYAGGQIDWPPPAGEPLLDRELLRDFLSSYLTAIVSTIENENEPSARGDYGDLLAEGQRVPSCYFEGRLPVLDLDRTLPDFALQTFRRYFENQVMGKAVLTPTLVAKLLSMAIAFGILVLYSEGLREVAGEDELSLRSLIRAFEIVEGDFAHSSGFERFFLSFEDAVAKLLET